VTPTVNIRREGPADSYAVRRVNDLAFGRPDEYQIVEALRTNGGVTLSLVAEAEGEVVGHIMFSPVTIDGQYQAVALGPMAVLPEHQRRGIGSQLVQAGLDTLREEGHEALFVIGHLEYYPRFGFVPASRFGIRWERPVPDEALMALELKPGALAGKAGVVRYRPEFDML